MSTKVLVTTSRNFEYAKKAHSHAMRMNNPNQRPEVRKAISEGNKGKTVSPKTKRLLSTASNFFKGHPVIDGITYHNQQDVVDAGLAKSKAQVDYRIRAKTWPNWTRTDLL